MTIDKSLCILVVDDREDLRKATCGQLRTLGFTQIHTAADGREALDILQSKAVELVISDWEMEPMDGIALVRALRTDRDQSALPFLMTTARSAPADRAAARQAGVDAYLVKPFTGSSLLVHMRRALATRRP